MTVLAPANFPASRVLAGWWRELGSIRPRAVWVGRFVLHRLEGLVRIKSQVALEPMQTLLLRLFKSAETVAGAPPWDRLSLSPALLFRIAHAMATEGMATQFADGAWKLTPKGLQALCDGKHDRVQNERRVFSFLATPDGESAHFIRLLNEPSAAAAAAISDPRFNPSAYHACFAQSVEWKRRFGFPDNVREVTESDELGPGWQSLLVDHAASVALALIRTREGSGQGGLLGFWTETEEWALQSATPAFRLAEGWQELFPTLNDGPALEDWQRAWQAWCQARGLPMADVERCSLAVDDCRLVIQAPRRLIERLQASRSDALKGEAWVLSGEGPLRRAVLLEVTEARAEGRNASGPSPRG